MKICLVCKKDFEPKSNNQKYCNDKCCDKQYYQNNKEKIIQRVRNWEKKNPEKTKIRRRRNLAAFRKRNPERFNQLMRENYKRNKNKQIARMKANKYIKIPKNQVCEFCKISKAVERHHSDYKKPLEIMFVCKSCNDKLPGIN